MLFTFKELVLILFINSFFLMIIGEIKQRIAIRKAKEYIYFESVEDAEAVIEAIEEAIQQMKKQNK